MKLKSTQINRVLFFSLALSPLVHGMVNIADLSDDITAPDIFTIGGGNPTVSFGNSVFESDLSTGMTNNTTGDIDFFNIVVEQGYQLNSIVLNSFSGGGQAFFGFGVDGLTNNSAIGAQQPGFVGEALGFTLLNGAETSLFTELAAGANGSVPVNGFDPNSPLAAGTYSFVFQNTGPNTNDYDISFIGSAVPEPTSGVFLLSSVALGLLRRRR